jgi:hypothetical protein
VKSISASAARETHLPEASPKAASVYWIVVQASASIAGDRRLDLGVHPDRDRHRGTSGQRCVDSAASAVVDGEGVLEPVGRQVPGVP